MNKEENNEERANFAQPRYAQNRFLNPESFTSWIEPPSFTNPRSWRNLFKWIFCEKNESQIPKEERRLEETLPVHKPQFPTDSLLGATWLGHATVFVRMDNLSMLTDPVWSSYASPLSWAGCRRYRPPPCKIDELPEIQIVVISHNHYDHLDHKAVKELAMRFPKMQWFVPRGLKHWMHTTIGGAEAVIHELNWGEHVEIKLPNSEEKFKIWSIPCQHWSQRALFDRNKSLWSGWLVQGPKHKFFYTGDTGFCEEEFKKVGGRFGPVDLSAIPIGCYAPRWFMQPQHIDPNEAVEIHQLVKSRKSIAIHWGTYEMGSTEPYMDPVSKLREAVEEKKLEAREFIALRHGGSWSIEEENNNRPSDATNG